MGYGEMGPHFVPSLSEEENPFKHVIGYGRGSVRRRTKKELSLEVLSSTLRKAFRTRSPGGSSIITDGGDDETSQRTPRIYHPSPRLRPIHGPAGRKVHSPGTKRGNSPTRKVNRTGSPKVLRASGRDSPKFHLGGSPKVRLGAGRDSPRIAGRVQKTTWRPKKSVHWKTNIATWIQMTAMNSSVSVSEASNCDIKEEDSSDFEYTAYGKARDAAESSANAYFGSLFQRQRDHPPLPAPPSPEDEAHYYSELECSCGCQESECTSEHTYEDLEDSIEDRVGRGAKPEVLGSLRHEYRLEAIKSTLVHVLPKDDIVSTTLLACRLGDLEYLQDLAKQSRLDPRSHDLQGATTFHYAARGGHVHVIRFLLEDVGERGVMRCDVGATPLHDAAALGHLPALKYLYKHSDHTLDLTDHEGATVLHVAASLIDYPTQSGVIARSEAWWVAYANDIKLPPNYEAKEGGT
ncbi:hypothetical protein C7M84_007189 [Penaeus vannamei]|uniref:Uncharacterized protein n=1 Tax=Penaeus vannamei TaxID=6689 RepID=A0A423TD76_PENVA|nr:hypothetical protein C7M84_007189 [Penaeus vannamei]